MVNNPEINAMSVVTVFAVTAAALCFAGYFAWRRRLVLAMVCLGCFLALFRPSVAMSAELCVPFRYADGDTFTFLRHGDNVRARLALEDAQRAKRGMWSHPDPLCAFDFRRSKNAK
jgi:endonuclease YncB( thermonuclease family)